MAGPRPLLDLTPPPEPSGYQPPAFNPGRVTRPASAGLDGGFNIGGADGLDRPHQHGRGSGTGGGLPVPSSPGQHLRRSSESDIASVFGASLYDDQRHRYFLQRGSASMDETAAAVDKACTARQDWPMHPGAVVDGSIDGRRLVAGRPAADREADRDGTDAEPDDVEDRYFFNRGAGVGDSISFSGTASIDAGMFASAVRAPMGTADAPPGHHAGDSWVFPASPPTAATSARSIDDMGAGSPLGSPRRGRAFSAAVLASPPPFFSQSQAGFTGQGQAGTLLSDEPDAAALRHLTLRAVSYAVWRRGVFVSCSR